MAVPTSNKSTVNGLLHRKECFIAVQCAWVLSTCFAHFSLSMVSIRRKLERINVIAEAVATATCSYVLHNHSPLHWVSNSTGVLTVMSYKCALPHPLLNTTSCKIIRLILESLPTIVLLQLFHALIQKYPMGKLHVYDPWNWFDQRIKFYLCVWPSL